MYSAFRKREKSMLSMHSIMPVQDVLDGHCLRDVELSNVTGTHAAVEASHSKS